MMIISDSKEKALEYKISCEGETEIWYFEWLQCEINKHPKVNRKVKFVLSKSSLSSMVKSNNTEYYKVRLKENGTIFCRVQDIESYENKHIIPFQNMLKSCREAKKILGGIDVVIGYSNFTFEMWMIAHKQRVTAVSHRKNYLAQINAAYGRKFSEIGDYKRKMNFSDILKNLTLDDVIHAVTECERIREHNEEFNIHNKKQKYGFEYFEVNPDTTLDLFVKNVLKRSGVLS